MRGRKISREKNLLRNTSASLEFVQLTLCIREEKAHLESEYQILLTKREYDSLIQSEAQEID